MPSSLASLVRDPYAEDYLALLEELVERRKKAGVSQASMAKRLGVASSTITRLESYERGEAAIWMLQAYAHALGLKITFTIASSKDASGR